jgi:spore germination cell wall hydrolase CwlJ-like protein
LVQPRLHPSIEFITRVVSSKKKIRTVERRQLMVKLFLALCAMLVMACSARAEQMNVPCSTEVVEVAESRVLLAIELMAKNIYFHRGHENNREGKKAITAAVFNRMNDCSHNWPRSIAGVITGGTERGKNCDFSWACNGPSKAIPKNRDRFKADYVLAERWFREYVNGTFQDPTDGATWFLHKNSTYPQSWPKLVKAGTFGQYTFFRYP